MKKIHIFHQNQGLRNLFAIFRLLDFFKTSLWWSKSILFYPKYKKNGPFWLCPKNTLDKIFDFFDKNHGLTPLKNYDFLDFFKPSLFWSKNHLYCPQYPKTIFSRANLQNKHPSWNIRLFDKNHGLTLFGLF